LAITKQVLPSKGTTAVERRRPVPFVDLPTLASKLPWKISFALAIGSFVVLHVIAGTFSQQITATSTTDLGGAVIKQYIHDFAMIMQYIIPAIFLTGGTVSLIKRPPSKSLIGEVRKNKRGWGGRRRRH
jgi:hypothetical protein